MLAEGLKRCELVLSLLDSASFLDPEEVHFLIDVLVREKDEQDDKTKLNTSGPRVIVRQNRSTSLKCSRV
jgi:hypothetical protein